MDFQSDKTRRSWDFQALGGVGIVFVIIIVDYYIFCSITLSQLSSKAFSVGVFWAIEVNFSVLMLCWSYYKVIYTGPGFLSPYINESFPNAEQIKERQKQMLKFKFHKKSDKKPTDHNNSAEAIDLENDADMQELKRIATNPSLSIQEVGYCFKCNRVKLPRTHHCRQCGRCVIRMDHHCPWTGNCVGLYNHKFFILFLIYATSSVFHVGSVDLYYYLTDAHGFNKGLNENDTLLLQVGIFMSYALTASIGFLAWFQINIGIHNLTTVESHNKELFKANPYNKGKMRNLEDIFGSNRATWMWPVDPNLQSEEYLFLLKNY